MDIKVFIKTLGHDGQSKPCYFEPASVEVKEQLKQPATFTITFSHDICDGDYQLIQSDLLNPFGGIEIWIGIDDKKYCLVKGIVQSQQIKLVHGGEGSQLQVSGAENSVRMGWVTEIRNWGRTMKREDILHMLSSIQKKKNDSPVPYHAFDEYHIMGKVYGAADATADKPAPENTSVADEEDHDDQSDGSKLSFDQVQMQREDDLAFIKRIGDQKGYYFWTSYDEMGREIAHFERLPLWEFDKSANKLGGDPNAMTLIINTDDNDIDDFSISWDIDRPTSVTSASKDPRTGKSIDNHTAVAPQPKLGNTTLDMMTDFLMEKFQTTTHHGPHDMADRANAALNDAEWFIKANCSTSYDRLCKKDTQDRKYSMIINAHTMINIQGAGSKHSGAYLVSGVTHTVDAGTYKVQLELLRNAWLDITKLEKTEPLVPAAEEPEKIPQTN